MRWTKTEGSSSAIYWHCTFTTVPFSVMITPTHDGVLATLHLVWNDATSRIVSSSPYSSVEEAKTDVNTLVMNHLALYSAQVHRECMEANTMTWRKLKEQMNEIPEEQLDEEVKVLDTAIDWCGTPSIVKAEEDQYKNDDTGHDVEGLDLDYCNHSVVVEKGHYYLYTEL